VEYHHAKRIILVAEAAADEIVRVSELVALPRFASSVIAIYFASVVNRRPRRALRRVQ
jgi:hypothetical protein